MLIIFGLFICAIAFLFSMYKWFKLKRKNEVETRETLMMMLMLAVFPLVLAVLIGFFLSLKLGKTLPVYQEEFAEERCDGYVIKSYRFAFKNWKHYMVAFPPDKTTKTVTPIIEGEK